MLMAEIETPSVSERRWFGAVIFTFFALVGALANWRLGATTAAFSLWGIGAGIALLYYTVRPLQVPLYKSWMYLIAPLGWVMSHFILSIIYFGLVTPIAFCMRLFGRDKLERRWLDAEATYWTEHPRETEPARYFRQS